MHECVDLFLALSSMTLSVTLAMACLKASTIFHCVLLSRIMRLPMSFFDQTPSGRILNRFATDVNILDNVLPMSIRMLLNFAIGVNRSIAIHSFGVVFCLCPMGFRPTALLCSEGKKCTMLAVHRHGCKYAT